MRNGESIHPHRTLLPRATGRPRLELRGAWAGNLHRSNAKGSQLRQRQFEESPRFPPYAPFVQLWMPQGWPRFGRLLTARDVQEAATGEALLIVWLFAPKPKLQKPALTSQNLRPAS